MIKTKAIVEVKVGERTYQMECPSDAPLGEVHDALCSMVNVVVQMMQANQEKMKEKPEVAA